MAEILSCSGVKPISPEKMVELIMGDTPDGLAKVYHDIGLPGVELNRAAAESGYTALHAAARMDNVALIILLLDRGAAVDPKSNWGETPLILASHLGHESSVLALIERGADASVRDNAGKTAAIHAKEQSNDYILSELRKAAKAGPRKDFVPAHPASQAAACTIS